MLQGQIAQQASIAFGGVLNGVDSRGKWLDFEHERQAYHAQYRALLNDFSVSFLLHRSKRKLNHAMHWFTHNALTHYSSPHGLEQPAGAAWGPATFHRGR